MNENAKTQSSATISHTERNTYDFWMNDCKQIKNLKSLRTQNI